jgi:hypothetical protein
MPTLLPIVAKYVVETKKLAEVPSTTEATFYPEIKILLAAILKDRRLPFDVRTNTSESGDLPDFVLGESLMVAGVFGEVKREHVALEELAVSTEHNDQIGRYLCQTGVVLLSNVRGFGLLVCNDGYERKSAQPVPPANRVLLKTVYVWSGADTGKVNQSAVEALVEIIERSVTDFARIADPADLAKILAHQARDAKNALPQDLKPAAQLLDDYRAALGLAFYITDEKGDRFFRSSLVQTIFYSLFAAWILWDRTAAPDTPFQIEDAHEHLPFPFLTALLHDIRNPIRLKHLGLQEHVARAVATLNRIDRKSSARG